MKEEITLNLYSDESRHTGSRYMVIGSVWGNEECTSKFKDKVNLIKAQHDIPKQREIKWTKVSPAKLDYYKDLIKLFFNEDGLNFRSVIIPTEQLRHKDFNQTEDDFYYKMQYLTLSNISRKHRSANYKIYLDFKDTWSNVRAKKLADYLTKDSQQNGCTFNAQPIRSYESVLLQLTDLLIGAVAYKANEGNSETSKAALVNLIEVLSSQKLNQKSPYGVDKFNIFLWEPR